MHESVSDILLERSRPIDGLNRMVLYSLLAHTLLIAAVAVMPASWRMSRSFMLETSNAAREER